MVRCFTINLNKGEARAELAVRRQRRTQRIVMAVFILVFLAIGALNLNGYMELKSIVEEKQDKIAQIERQLEELQRSGQNVSKQDVLALAKLEQKRFLWTRRLESLAEIMPQDMAITGLEFHNLDFTIKAISQIKKDQKEFDQVVAFMDMLKSTPFFYTDFDGIRFEKSSRITIEDQDILSMAIVCQVGSELIRAPGSRSRRTTTSSTAFR
jgi:Tfp pilus assembly protein PilN